MSLGSAVASGISFVEKMAQGAMHLIQDVPAYAAKVQPVANFVGSIVSIADPAAAPMIQSVLNTATYVESQFAAAGSATGTGAEKLTLVVSLIGPMVAQALQKAGKPNASADVNKVVSDIVDIGKTDPNIWDELKALLGVATGSSTTPAPTTAPVAQAASVKA